MNKRKLAVGFRFGANAIFLSLATCPPLPLTHTHTPHQPRPSASRALSLPHAHTTHARQAKPKPSQAKVMSSTTESARRRDIKAGNSVADLRRRRSSMAVSLRKAKKEQGQAKRRNTARPTSTTASADGVAAPGSSSANTSGQQQRPVTAADVPELAKALGGAPEGRTEAARGLRKVLSLESDPPVNEVIEAGAMPLLVLCLDEHSNTDLQVSTLALGSWMASNNYAR